MKGREVTGSQSISRTQPVKLWRGQYLKTAIHWLLTDRLVTEFVTEMQRGAMTINVRR